MNFSKKSLKVARKWAIIAAIVATMWAVGDRTGAIKLVIQNFATPDTVATTPFGDVK